MPFSMTFKERDEKALELLEVLGMWGMTKEDAQSIASRLMVHASNVKGSMLPNKLHNTGLKPISASEKAELQKKDIN